MRFSPQATFTIQVGDTVNFTQGSMHTPHGVAINESGSFIDLESNQFIMGQGIKSIVAPSVLPNYSLLCTERTCRLRRALITTS